MVGLDAKQTQGKSLQLLNSMTDTSITINIIFVIINYTIITIIMKEHH